MQGATKTQMDHNFKLEIEYDGTSYNGWQRQLGQPSIQQTIEAALARMTRRQITLIGSGRTDAGVHALGQVANFKSSARIEASEFQKGLNSLLPGDIVIRSCERVDAAFHARFDVKRKIYRYHILNRDLPAAIGRHYSWWIRRRLDLQAMRAAAEHFLGKKDFKAFEATGSPRSDTIRTVTRALLTQAADRRLVFEIEADGFLRYMVRNIVGTLVEVGHGKFPPGDIPGILQARDRAKAGATAPPHGLFLVEVIY